MLQSYYDESHELLLEYEREWYQDLAYFKTRYTGALEENNELSEETTPDDVYLVSDFLQEGWSTDPPDEADPLSSLKSLHPEWAKKLFRKIATITHPDKASNDNKEKFSKLFRQASEALTDEDYEQLLSVALSLDLPFGIDSAYLVPLLQKRIKDIKERIITLEKEAPWVWGESFGIPQLRAPLLKVLLAGDGIEKTVEELRKDIVERENQNATR